MHPNTIIRKTSKGLEEVATRQHGLPMRMRALLIPVNGSKSAGAIAQTHPQGLQSLDMMDILLEQGFIETVGTVPATPPPTAPANPPPPQPPAATDIGDSLKVTLLQRYLADFVNNTLGFMGGDIVTRIQTINSLAELENIARSCTEVVTAVAGQRKAQTFQAEVNKLLGKT